MKFKFKTKSGDIIETEAKTELGARRKIRRIERELTLKNVIYIKDMKKLELLKEDK